MLASPSGKAINLTKTSLTLLFISLCSMLRLCKYCRPWAMSSDKLRVSTGSNRTLFTCRRPYRLPPVISSITRHRRGGSAHAPSINTMFGWLSTLITSTSRRKLWRADGAIYISPARMSLAATSCPFHRHLCTSPYAPVSISASGSNSENSIRRYRHSPSRSGGNDLSRPARLPTWLSSAAAARCFTLCSSLSTTDKATFIRIPRLVSLHSGHVNGRLSDGGPARVSTHTLHRECPQSVDSGCLFSSYAELHTGHSTTARSTASIVSWRSLFFAKHVSNDGIHVIRYSNGRYRCCRFGSQSSKNVEVASLCSKTGRS